MFGVDFRRKKRKSGESRGSYSTLVFEIPALFCKFYSVFLL